MSKNYRWNGQAFVLCDPCDPCATPQRLIDPCDPCKPVQCNPCPPVQCNPCPPAQCDPCAPCVPHPKQLNPCPPDRCQIMVCEDKCGPCGDGGCPGQETQMFWDGCCWQVVDGLKGTGVRAPEKQIAQVCINGKYANLVWNKDKCQWENKE